MDSIRRACIVDLDNFAIADGRGIPAADLAPALKRALQFAGDVQYKIASAPRSTIRKYASTLASVGLRWRIVRVGKDTADIDLLTQAEHLAAVGYSEFVVISADHAFAALARRFPTTVIIRAGQNPSGHLRRAATRVIAA